MEHLYQIEYDDLRLRPLGWDDIEALRIWRNDPAKTRFLTPIGTVTPQMQREWFRACLARPDEMLFAIEETRDLRRIVGSVSLYHIRPDTAEIGRLLIGDDAAGGRGLGRKALAMLLWLAFDRLGLRKVTGNVSPYNIPAHKTDMDIGFAIVGRHPMPDGGCEDEIEMTLPRLVEACPYVSEIRISQYAADTEDTI